MGKMKKCKKCGTYTFSEICPNCGSKTSNPEPPKFSPADKYGKYRRKLLEKINRIGRTDKEDKEV
jgi:H/ACA ribonucleoprotein complex subunit 3